MTETRTRRTTWRKSRRKEGEEEEVKGSLHRRSPSNKWPPVRVIFENSKHPLGGCGH